MTYILSIEDKAVNTNRLGQLL